MSCLASWLISVTASVCVSCFLASSAYAAADGVGIEKLNELSNQIIKEEIALERLNVRFEIQSVSGNRWKGWRYFAFQEPDAALLEAGLITGIAERDFQIHHSVHSQAVVLEHSLIPQMIGQFIGPVGDLDELAVNALHAWKAHRVGLGSTTVKQTSIRLKEHIKDLLEQRSIILRQSSISQSDKELFEAEGNLLADIADVVWRQTSRTQRTQYQLGATQNAFYLLDSAKNLTGALGNLVGLVSLHQVRPRLNVQANELTTISGSFIMVNPQLSRLMGRMSARFQSRRLAPNDRGAAEQAIAKLNQDLRIFKKLSQSSGNESETVSNPVNRMATVDKQIGRFSVRLQKDERSDQKAFTAALGRTAVGALSGSSKVASGITGIIAAGRYTDQPKKGAPLLLGGTISYAAGTDIILFDNLRLEILREIRYQRDKAAGTLPRKLLEEQLTKLDSLDQTLMQLK
jgi:hypothetical protein